MRASLSEVVQPLVELVRPLTDLVAALEIPDGRPGALETLQQNERELVVRDAVRKLKSRHQAVLLLRDWEELSYAEISTVLGVPEGTVKSLLHRGLQRLRKLMQ